MAAYYNEIDTFAVAWLRQLIKDGLIADGEVDERSIKEVVGADLAGFTQCHFFAGIGGWSYALRLAGWQDTRPVWTGSCPCQPFSSAGGRQGESDPRHLWPDLRRLISECAPPLVFGEQVASADGRVWLAGVQSDLEAVAYLSAAADLCAAGVGAPHIRQRLYWMAHPDLSQQHGQQSLHGENSIDPGSVAESEGEQHDRDWATRRGRRELADGSGLGHAASKQARDARQPWGQADTVECADGKTRRLEPGAFPLAHGIPRRMDKIRGYGNAIVPQVAAEFIQAASEAVMVYDLI